MFITRLWRRIEHFSSWFTDMWKWFNSEWKHAREKWVNPLMPGVWGATDSTVTRVLLRWRWWMMTSRRRAANINIIRCSSDTLADSDVISTIRGRPTNTPVILRHFWDKYQKDPVRADRRQQQPTLLALDVNHKTQTVDPSSVCFSARRSDPELQRVLLTTNLIISVSRFSSVWIFSSSVTVNWISLGCGQNETFEDDVFNHVLIFFL